MRKSLVLLCIFFFTATSNFPQFYYKYTLVFASETDYGMVTNIVNVPVEAVAGTPFAFTGVVVPDNAANKDIQWSVRDAGTNGAMISGNTLNATAAGIA